MSDSTFAYNSPGEVIAAGVVFPVLGITTVILRFVARRGKKHNYGMDDWLAAVAVLLVTAMGICLLIGVANHVLGYPSPPPASDDPEEQVTGILPGQRLMGMLEYVFFVFMIAAYGCIKMSVLFFYRRIFASGSRTFDWITKACIGLSIVWTLGFLFAQIFGCGSHFDNYWGSLQDLSYCNDGLVYLNALMISDFISDFLIVFLPFPLIWRLHMSNSRKWAVMGILLLGSVSLGASLARLILQSELSHAGYGHKTDLFLTITSILYWSMIEAGIAIIAICLPTLQTLFNVRSVNSMVASVRSVVSLNSLRSQHSNGMTKHDQDFKTQATSIHGMAPATVDTTITEGAERDEIPPMPNAIHIKQGFSQTAEDVA